MKNSPVILWFRIDLRLGDNPALQAALKHGGGILPVFIYAPEEESPWSPGAASRWWLHQSLSSLGTSLRQNGSRLIIRRGPTLESLRALAAGCGARAVFWNRRYEPAGIDRDRKIREALVTEGFEVESFNGTLLHELWTIQNQSRKPFQVFTAFWRHCLSRPAPAKPLTTARKFPAPDHWPETHPLETLELQPQHKWAESIQAVWRPGEAGALQQLKRFLKTSLSSYDENRNRPGSAGSSRLSPHLHFGEITPRQIWHAVRRQAQAKGIPEAHWRGLQFLT